MNLEEAVLSTLATFAREQTAIFEKLAKNLEKIQAGYRVQKTNAAIRENHLGQGDLVGELLRNEGFKNLIKGLDSKRAGYKEACYIIASTFPRGRFVTMRGVYQRLQLFGWTRNMTYAYFNHLRGRRFRWYRFESNEEEQEFVRNLFDYELARSCKGKPPREAVCLNDDQRQQAYQYLRDVGLGKVADFIQEKT